MSPYFHNFAEFIAMGGHGSYVWSTWLLTVVVIVALVFFSRSQRKATYRCCSRRANNSVISVRLRAVDTVDRIIVSIALISVMIDSSPSGIVHQK